MKKMIEPSNPFVLNEAVEYVENSVIINAILQKPSGMVIATAVDAGKGLAERTSPFDTLVQVTDGTAEVFIDSRLFRLSVGEAVIIPAHRLSSMTAVARFKIISTTMKSGYEDLV